MTPAYFAPVPLDKSYRLLNHGPTVLVSARHAGVADVMAAAWADARVFRDGRWQFDTAPDELRTLHHVAGGQFFVTGAAVQA